MLETCDLCFRELPRAEMVHHDMAYAEMDSYYLCPDCEFILT